MKIYVASSWRNDYQPSVVKVLREVGHKVYDFKNPEDGNSGFSWREIDKEWKNWNTNAWKNALGHSVVQKGFLLDSAAVSECDLLVLVLPCGRSAHLEAGFAAGKGKEVIAYVPREINIEPELMYSWFEDIVTNLSELILFANNCEKKIVTKSYRDYQGLPRI